MKYTTSNSVNLIEERVLSGINIQIVQFKFDDEFELEFKSNTFSFMLPLNKGKIVSSVGKKRYHLDEKRLFLLKKNTVVKISSIEKYTTFIAIMVSQEGIDRTNMNCSGLNVSEGLLVKNECKDINRWLFECIHRYYFELITDRFNVKYAKSFLEVEIIKEMFFLLGNNETVAKDDFYPSIETLKKMPIPIENAIRFLESRPIQEINVKKLCKQSGASQSTLNRQFQQYYGVSSQAFILKRKMIFAKELLKNKKLSLFDIAELLGFKSASAFITSFKRNFAITPNKYRHILL